MTRRFLSLLLISVLIFGHCFAKADVSARNVFEFMELYTERATIVQQGLDCELPSASYFSYPSLIIDNCIDIFTPAGTITFDAETFEIKAAEITYFSSLSSDEKESLSDTYNCIIAFSALEYDANEDNLFALTHSFLGSSAPKNAVEKATEILAPINKALDDQTATDQIASAEGLFIYQGDYKYYLRYVTLEDDGKTVLNEFQLIALKE